MLFFWPRRKRSEKREAAEHALMNPDDVNGIGALSEALWLGDRALQASAEKALIRLLPRIREQDAHLLNTEQRDCLNRALESKNIPLVLSILKALEQIGDETSLPLINRMIIKGSRSRSDGRRHILGEAMEVLSIIDARMEINHMTTTLLRPSQQTIYTDNLLTASQAPGVPSSALIQSEPPSNNDNK